MSQGYHGGTPTPPFGYPGPGYGPVAGGPVAGGPVAGGPQAPIPGGGYPYSTAPLRRSSPPLLGIGTVIGISLVVSVVVCTGFFALWIAFGTRLMPMAVVLPAQADEQAATTDAAQAGAAPAAAPQALAQPAAPAAPAATAASRQTVPAAEPGVSPAPAVPGAAAEADAAPYPAPAQPVAAAAAAVQTQPVPAVTRLKLGGARTQLRQAGFRPEVRFQPYNEDVSPLMVVGQDPPAGTALEPGQAVVIFVNPEE